MNSLPLKNTDVVIVSIGEDEGANLLTTAFMKKLNVPKLVCRSVSPIHATILEAMEISEIMRPEEETAERWDKKLTSNGIIDSFELTDNYSVVQVEVPKKFAGKTIAEVGFNQYYQVLVLTVMKNVKEKGLFGMLKKTSKLHIEGVAKAYTQLEEGDVIVLYGHNDHIYELLKND
jgi:trk system potassium uptake protein TrkA